MANVNLISARRAERVRLTRLARGLAFSCVVAGTVGVVTSGFMAGQVFLARTQLGALNTELEKLRPIRAQIEADERERLAIQPKLTTLQEAQERTRRWFGIMDGLKRSIPSRTWLTNLQVEQSSPDAARTLRINGVSDSQTRVGETMFRLSLQHDYFQKVDLGFTTTKREQEREDVEFELRAALHDTEDVKTGGANASQTN